MNTATIPDCKILVQLAADHPEKLEAINEFLKNIIVLVDLTGKAEQKKAHGFTVKTKKIRLLANRGFWHFVNITDGKREANFLNNGENVLTLADFADGANANGLRFWMHRQEPGQLHKFDVWRKGQNRNKELSDMLDFVNECLSVPVNYADEGEMTYTY